VKLLTALRVCSLPFLLWCSFAPFGQAAPSFGERYALEVLPSEARPMTDEESGAELLFLTSGPTENKNLYFHERSWLQDSSMILFHTHREPSGLMGYLVETGELVRFRAADGTPLSRATATASRPTVYAMAGNRVVEVAVDIEASSDPRTVPSAVWARERRLCEIENTSGSLNESCDGRYLSLGGTDPEAPDSTAIFLISATDGATERLCGMPPGTTAPVTHVQWSKTNPYWLSFANQPVRIWVVDIRDGTPWAPYVERPGELVTHEVWWVNDLLIFCGGIHPFPTEDAHVKTLDPRTGEVRIVGEGAWWPEGTPPEIAKRNWWHPAGSLGGHWVVADNWHGDIMLFEGLTARPRLLTQGHRTYGGGAHPEPGWDRRGEQVVFASHKLGEGVHVCVATIPPTWQEEVRELGRRIESVVSSEH